MKMHLNFTPIEKALEKIEKQSVTVGVLDPNVRAASIDHDKPITTLSTASGSTMRRYAKRKGRNKNIRLTKLAVILDAQKGIFSNVLINPNNKDLINVAQQLAIFNKTAADIKRLENAARALVRNPILRKDYGENSASTVHGYFADNGHMINAGKGFSHWGFATGTLFKNIKAEYKKW